jgi:predicted AAA+ superfamily ATPase
VQQYLDQLIGHPEKGGHYFTVRAPRQTGKTWLIRQVVQEIKAKYLSGCRLVWVSVS